MNVPNWTKLELVDGVFREPSPDGKQLVLWLRRDQVDGYLNWERIGTVAGAEIASERGLCWTTASVIRARQKVRGVFDRLLSVFRKQQEQRMWLLPTGDGAEQVGERENDRLLVWSEPRQGACDEARIREQWGAASEVCRLANSLFMVLKRETPVEPANANDILPEIRPIDQAKDLLLAARKSGDCLKQAPPLIDLGIICVQNGKIPQAIALFERALAIARKFNDRALECDAQTNLATAYLASGQLGLARALLETELVYATEVGDGYQQKLILTHLGAVHAKRRDHARAMGVYEHALGLARRLADRLHEAELLWFLAVQCAELGRQEEAIGFGQTAVELCKEMGNPAAAEYLKSLDKYRLDVNVTLSGLNECDTSQQSDPSQAHGPGLFQMTVSATKSMVQFLVTGFKTVTSSTYEKRLQTCNTCPHHSGVRCKLCGCFTTVKARLPHENCPLAKWSAA